MALYKYEHHTECRMFESSCWRGRPRTQRRQDALLDKVLVEAVVLGQLGVERCHEVPALPERHDGPMVPGVGVVFVVRYDGLAFWKE